MVAGGKETAFEVAVKMITAPIWFPIDFAYLGCRRWQRFGEAQG